MSGPSREPTGLEVAVIGLAGRFPGARDVGELWRNLCDGVESVTFYDDDELRAAGHDEAALADPRWVKAEARLEGVELFDAALFGIHPREAEIMDPQQRIFLECAAEAFDSAGYDPGAFDGRVGVYAGSGLGQYLLHHLAPNPAVLEAAGEMAVLLGNDKDYLTTRVAYKLDLEGPSVTVQTACSSSLVAVHMACQALLDGDCDMALAGGVTVRLPPRPGYLYEKENIFSPDGHCRAFDAAAAGTIAGSGTGAVVLRRLEDAVAGGDLVRSVILATAVNNDGATKVGFTAPRVEGQARVIRDALAAARIDPATLGLVEAHGTGTAMGDPIEVEALVRAFRGPAQPKGSCALGSIKTNVGHLDTAAGIAGLIKTVLALEAGRIPPSLHFERPNPRIAFAESPFYVNTEPRPWPAGGAPRRAAVSSFGVGGTNAHAVLEQAPPRAASGPARPWQLFVLSAASAPALEAGTDRLAAHLEQAGDAPGDVAHTLAVGRRPLSRRRFLVCRESREAARILSARDPERLLGGEADGSGRPLVFLFPGQGSQHCGMGRELYAGEAVFRRYAERCLELLEPHLDVDLEALLFKVPRATANGELRRTYLAQPALFVVEYALARTWMDWGLSPSAMAGHSLGEWVAACLAGVFSLEDALALVAARGRLMQEQPPGAMLAVARLPAREALPSELSLAAVNTPNSSVVAGPLAAIEAFAAELDSEGVEHQSLHTSHGFHSTLMAPAVTAFERHVERVRLSAPRIPFLSNTSGTWVTEREATDPGYWARQLRRTVRFSEGLEELFTDPRRILLEVGPGRALTSLVKRHRGRPDGLVALASLPHPRESGSEAAHLLTTLGRLWSIGRGPDWRRFFAGETRRRVLLPTYAFDRQRYWIERPSLPDAALPRATPVLLDHRRADPGGDPGARVAPRTATEERVAEIWQEALGLERISVHDAFLELGGHSLLATRLVARLESALGVELSIGELFEASTVARLSELVERRRRQARGVPAELPLLEPRPESRYEPFALTDVQHAYWVGRGAGLELGQVATHAYSELECEDLDPQRLGDAWNHLVERHNMLRAIVRPDGLQQVLAQVPPYEIALHDLRDQDGESTAAEIERIRREMSHQVLAADRWPLFELRISRLEPRRWRLHFSFDFLIGDGWSLEILSRELDQLYRDPELAPAAPEPTFRDYVLALEAMESSAAVRRSFEYWQARLGELPPAPELPLAKRPSSIDRPRFKRRSGHLGAERWQRLASRARRAGLAGSTLLLSAFSEVLAAWSKQPRFTVNLTLFNRLPLHPEVDRIVGDFTSLTLLAVDSRSAATFEGRARALQERLWKDLDHRHTSGVRVLRELNRAAGGASQILMPVVFTSLLNLGSGVERESAGTAWRRVYGVSQTPQVYLDHQVFETAAGLGFHWDALEELFPPGLLDEMFSAWVALLERLAESEEAWRGGERLPVPAAQLARRGAARACWPAPSLGSLFTSQAGQRPGHTAVVSQGERLSYGELARMAAQVGTLLRARGVGPGVLVAVATRRGGHQVAAVLAVQAAEGAYLPVDPDLPAERRRYLLEHGRVRVLLTLEELARNLDWPAGLELVALDALPPAGQDAWPEPLAPRQDLAYVIFTSGSTGRPKGVAIDHGGVVNTLLDVNRRFAVTHRDRVLAVSSLSFDLSVYDVFGLLAAGGTVVVPEAGAERDAERWLELMDGEGVTIWNSVPALMELLVEAAEGRNRALPESLRLVLLSGDWIAPELPERIRRLAPAARVVSLGGATEASIWSILFPVARVDPAWPSIPYGKAMCNQSVRVLDADLEPRPDRVTGQLYIGGDGVARGYWAEPARTAASFVPDPLVPSGRLYRTGDLGRYLPDGNIEFLGREDFQVKIRGHRIELGEIEAVLQRHPDVDAAVAAAVGEATGRRRLVAHVVARGAGIDITRLREHLAAHLPAYMVPDTWVERSALPLSPNGKVDRKALRVPEEAPATAPVRAEAGGQVEELLRELYREVLEVEHVALDDDLFELGGSSLAAVRLVSRIRQAFGVELALRDVFATPVLARLAGAVRGAARGGAGDPPPPIEPATADERRRAPLSFQQERLWVVHQLEPDSAAYNLAWALRLTGPLSPPALGRAAKALERRHEGLRTRFVYRDEGPLQEVVTALTAPSLPVVDLAALASQRREEVVKRLARAEIYRPFDLECDALLRWRLLRLDEREHVLVFAAHHIVIDGWSLAVVLRELSLLYQDPASPSLPPLHVQYADFARWQRRWMSGEVLERGLTWWRRHLRGAPRRVNLSEMNPSGQAAERGENHLAYLPAALKDALGKLCREERVTLFMALLSAFQVLIYRMSSQSDLVIGTDLANRTRGETEGLIGLFVNTMPLRTDLSGDPSWRQLLRRVREATLGAYTQEEVPLDRLVADLQPERGTSPVALFNVLFVHQNTPAAALAIPGLTVEPIALDWGTSRFELALFVSEEEDRILTRWEFLSHVVSRPAVARMAGRYGQLLASAVTDPDRRLDELEYLTKEERAADAERRGREKAGRFKRFKAVQPRAVSLEDDPVESEPVEL